MGTRDERASRTRADLMAAAKRLFGEHGYLDTKIADIAAGAGRAVGSFYTHFDDKKQLLTALRNELTETAAPGPASEDPIREHVTACWTALRTHRHRPAAIGDRLRPDLRTIVGRADHLDGPTAQAPGKPTRPR